MTNQTNVDDEMMLLHKLVYENEVVKLKEHLSSPHFNRPLKPHKDVHGNTCLHLAVMLGRKECIKTLLQNKCFNNCRNIQGWTPLQEAISYGDRDIIFDILESSRKDLMRSEGASAEEILSNFEQDFKLKLNWQFTSWLPFVSNILPSDTCEVYCKGNLLRLDSTIEDFQNFKWIRGNLSIISDFSYKPKPRIYLIDHNKQTYHRMDKSSNEEREADLNEDIDLLMSSDIIDASLKTKNIKIERCNAGWFLRRERTEQVGQFSADVYKISNIDFVQKKRREHLSDRDIQRNRRIRESIIKPQALQMTADEDVERRTSIPPPTNPFMSWEEYINSESDAELGRFRKEKTTKRAFEANVFMSDEFPVKIEDLLNILEMLGPQAKLYKRIKEFVTDQLPPGFPVRITVPLIPTIKATVSFLEFEYCSDLDSSLFQVPSHYKLETNWRKKTTK